MYTIDWSGSRSRMEARTEMPPSPESKTPIGASGFVMLNSSGGVRSRGVRRGDATARNDTQKARASCEGEGASDCA